MTARGWLVAGVCALLPGCASMQAGELARDALARCASVATIDYRGGRLSESASTHVNCRPVLAQERTWSR